jgi:hypothetical protein
MKLFRVALAGDGGVLEFRADSDQLLKSAHDVTVYAFRNSVTGESWVVPAHLVMYIKASPVQGG